MFVVSICEAKSGYKGLFGLCILKQKQQLNSGFIGGVVSLASIVHKYEIKNHRWQPEM